MGESIARAASPDDAAPSAVLSRQAGRNRRLDDRDGDLPDRRRAWRRQSLPASAFIARTHGAQIAEAAVRNCRRAGIARPLHSYSPALDRGPPARPGRSAGLWYAA